MSHQLRVVESRSASRTAGARADVGPSLSQVAAGILFVLAACGLIAAAPFLRQVSIADAPVAPSGQLAARP